MAGKGINSKSKGNGFERKVAKALSEWSKSEFHRTPGSGALHWSNDSRVVSDIVPSQELMEKGWPFSIECKNVMYEWDFSTIIEGTSTFWKHWKQCWDDSQREKMLPMLVFTKNYRDIFMAITEDTFRKLNINPSCIMSIENQEFSLYLMKFTEFMNLISIDEMLERL